MLHFFRGLTCQSPSNAVAANEWESAKALAGKTIKCPACGDRLQVTAAPPSRRPRTPVKKDSASPAIYISKGKIIAVAFARRGVMLGLIFYFGPVRVWNQWEDIGGKAGDDVSNVITFGLQAYLSQQGEYNPRDAHSAAAVDGPVHFFRPTLAMSMPEKVKFFGKSTQGDIPGFYHPSTAKSKPTSPMAE